jgi:hypothetical protein
MRRIPFPKLFTLADVAARTQLSRDTIQRWGNLGILESESHTTHGGRGVHRRFRDSELVIAVLLRSFAHMDVPAGQLLRLAGVLRGSLGLQAGMVQDIHYEAGMPLIRQALHRGLYTHKETYLAIGFSRDDLKIELILWDDEGEGDAGADDGEEDWPLRKMFRAAHPPEVVHVIDLATLYGLLGETP